MSIKKIHARQIFDSRGNPTVEVDLHTGKGMFRAAVPSGASTGVHEALEMRDGGKEYMGKGVSKAVANVNNVIAPALVSKGLSVVEQEKIDNFMLELDGTENKGEKARGHHNEREKMTVQFDDFFSSETRRQCYPRCLLGGPESWSCWKGEVLRSGSCTVLCVLVEPIRNYFEKPTYEI